MKLEKTLDLLLSKIYSWFDAFVVMLPNLVVALIVVVAFSLAARLIRRVVANLLNRVSSNQQITQLLATISYVIILMTGVFVALGILKLDKTVTSLIAGVGIIGLALGFAFQDLAANFMSGILMSIRRPFSIGDMIATSSFEGMVQEINLRATVINTFQGQAVILPNKQVFENAIVNYSQRGKRRVDLAVGVSYGDDLEKAKEVTVKAVEAITNRDTGREVELYYREFGDSSINFEVRFWIDFRAQSDFLQARSEAVMRIKAAFDENGITIPFPIRTLDFGIVGGEKLSDVLPRSLYASNGDG